jgi:hypothetical protein
VRVCFELELPQELYRELIDGCRERSCSPKQYAGEALESLLAERRMRTQIELGRYGPRMHEHKILVPEE